MLWIITILRSFGLGLVLLGLTIGLNTVDETRAWKNVIRPIILVCLGAIIIGVLLPTFRPEEDVTSFILGLNGLNLAIGILLPWLCIVIGLGRKLQTGSLFVRVGQFDRQRIVAFAPCLMLTLFALCFTALWIEAAQQPWFRYSLANANTIYMPFVLGTLALYHFFRGMNGLELRQKGITYALLTLKWRQISSYQWVSSEEIRLILHFKPRLPFFSERWIITIPAFKQDAVARVLAAHLPEKAERSEVSRWAE